MTLANFVIRNTLRNKRRTLFTVLSIGFSLFLLILLITVLDILLNPPRSEASTLRLAVRRNTTLADQMPLAYLDKIRKVPHVEMVMPFQWYGGYYKEPKNFFGNLACDPDVFFKLFTELEVTEETQKAFSSDRQAAVAGEGLMERYGWKVGDSVTLIGTIFPVDLEFHIAGTYKFDLDKNNFYFRFDYLNEALNDPGTVSSIWIKADKADSIPGIVDTIDGMFRNTSAETLTETEKAFQLGFIQMLGNIRVLIGSIALVVVFTMILVAASTMAMTIRERMREVAILKAIGFPRRSILSLILGEAVLVGFGGFLLAALFALTVRVCESQVYTLTQGFIPFFRPPVAIFGYALATAVGVGAIAGLVPALQASSMTITDAMRRLE